MRVLSDGTGGDERVWESRSGTRCWRRGRLERGGLRERFASVLMMRCEAERWLSAEVTWEALNAGLRGTFSKSAIKVH